jgi:hypothetical protein
MQGEKFCCDRQAVVANMLNRNGIRWPEYGPQDYFNEFGWLLGALNGNDNIPIKNNLLAPSTAGSDVFSGQWTPEMVFDTGFLDAYRDRISIMTVEQ